MPAASNQHPGHGRSPKMYIWAREVLFLGVCHARQQAHRATQDKLILSLKGDLEVLAGQHRLRTRSCLVSAGVALDCSKLDATQAVVAIYHLAPFSQDHAQLSRLMKPALPGIAVDHPNQHAAIAAATLLRDQPHLTAAAARAKLRATLFPPPLSGSPLCEFDPRVIAVARRLRETLAENIALQELAAEVGLSPSRLAKLFKAQAGLPVTQYRLRYRVFISSILMAMGYPMTQAAFSAGFASSAHLSRSYRAIAGLTPSDTFLKPPQLHTVVDASAVDLVAHLLTGKQAV